MQQTLFFRFGVALAIGFLVGLEREYDSDDSEARIFGGVRTFSILGLLGCGVAMLADLVDSPLPYVAFILAFAGLLAIAYFMDARRGHVGLTTEAAALLVMVLGSLVYLEETTLAVAVGVTATVLLSVKVELQRFVERITREDVYASLTFAVISAIVLPVLPNEDFGIAPFDIFNPYRIWLLVVFISGLSFVGYVLIKAVGARRGIELTGLLGGLASSTALTLSFTQRSHETRTLERSLALAIIIAWTVMYARVVVVVLTVSRSVAAMVWMPLVLTMGAGVLFAIYLFRTQQREGGEEEEVAFNNPFELRPAILFGLLFAVVLLLSRVAQFYAGDTGIYVSSVLAGLADVDAITLSVLQLAQGTDPIATDVAARAIVLAAVANTLAKGGLVLVGGSPALRRIIAPGYLLFLATGIGATFLI